MRDTETEKKINQSKRSSKIDDTRLILQDKNNREFFRFSEGRLEEYELTRANGLSIKLKPEEIEGEEAFDFLPL